MGYAPVETVDADRIPVIDVATLFDPQPAYRRVGDALRAASETMGFFYVTGHGIDPALTSRVFDTSRAFFAAAEDDKATVRINEWHRGLLAVGEAKMEGQARSDYKESYLWGVDVAPGNADFAAGNVMLPPNQWPAFLPEMRPVLNDYMAAAHRCGKQLLRAIAVSLDVDADYFVRFFDKPVTRGSLIYYPPQPPKMGIDQYGVSPHTDYGTLTLLAQDMNGGLRVRDLSGRWLAAHPIEGTLVVNVGDLLARWSNDRFRSTVHCVVNESGRERYSVAIAMDPNWETPVRPVVAPGDTPHYEEVSCGEYIQGRFNRSFSYRQ